MFRLKGYIVNKPIKITNWIVCQLDGEKCFEQRFGRLRPASEE